MPTAVKMEMSLETIIRAVKGMKKSARRAFMEDLIAATSPEHLQSIRDARRSSGDLIRDKAVQNIWRR